MRIDNKSNLERKNTFSYRSVLKLIALILSLFLLQGCSQNVEKSKEPVNSGDLSSGPRLVVDTDTYDFGKIIEESAKKGSFNLYNVGDEALVIKDIEICCGAVINIEKKRFCPAKVFY